MKNSDQTVAFLSVLDAKTKNEILSNIANHYGISKQEAFEEITDEDAECIIDYLTGSVRPAISLLFNKFNYSKNN